eukprot:5724051-Alexandrium_andersonii.AAC.1
MASLVARGSNVRSFAAAPGTRTAAQQQVTDAKEAGWTYVLAGDHSALGSDPRTGLRVAARH